MRYSKKLKWPALFLVSISFFSSAAFGGSGGQFVFLRSQPPGGVITYTSDRYHRTELYFGLSKPGGSEVTPEEWAQFLADEVTPRFPGGFTVIEALGQYQGDDKKIVKEKSRVLILLYEKKDRKRINVKIEDIRQAYKKVFQQESVMRLDMRQTVNVSF
jgi:hypothetical protein